MRSSEEVVGLLGRRLGAVSSANSPVRWASRYSSTKRCWRGSRPSETTGAATQQGNLPGSGLQQCAGLVFLGGPLQPFATTVLDHHGVRDTPSLANLSRGLAGAAVGFSAAQSMTLAGAAAPPFLAPGADFEFLGLPVSIYTE